MIITLTTPELENLAKGHEFPKTDNEYFIAKGIAAEIAERRGEDRAGAENIYEEINSLRRELEAEQQENEDTQDDLDEAYIEIKDLKRTNREMLDTLKEWVNASWLAGYAAKEGSDSPIEHLLTKTHKSIANAEEGAIG